MNCTTDQAYYSLGTSYPAPSRPICISFLIFHQLEQNTEFNYILPAKAIRYTTPVLVDSHLEVCLSHPGFVIDSMSIFVIWELLFKALYCWCKRSNETRFTSKARKNEDYFHNRIIRHNILSLLFFEILTFVECMHLKLPSVFLSQECARREDCGSVPKKARKEHHRRRRGTH